METPGNLSLMGRHKHEEED
ncbi:uncharacterized protein G2W53_041779 [Senna tora]|uniref:Uncharacterized protein n=1 Tax=Senna tora TaxID=362788 RepID=A0A834VYB7_9FABA|nr:uncharacterized protein G2W53_041779 [Senna tora]